MSGSVADGMGYEREFAEIGGRAEERNLLLRFWCYTASVLVV